MSVEYRRDNYLITTDPARFDVSLIHDFLSHSYWATNVPLSVVQKSIDNTLCFAIFEAEHQVGFARVITDRATFAWLADVFVLESHRGRGLSKWLMACILAHPDLQGLRRWMLGTRDAHGLYRQFGFEVVEELQQSDDQAGFQGLSAGAAVLNNVPHPLNLPLHFIARETSSLS